MVSSSKVETNNCESGAINKGVLEEMKSLLHEFEGVETEIGVSQTNQFQHSFTELVIENMDFSQAKWKTIKNGMERLPNGCAQLIGDENKFDKVLMALPPAALRVIETPTCEPTVQRRPKHNRSAIAMMTDAVASLPKNENEHIYLGLRELKKVYARAPEGNIYFASEHLSTHHTWILGALDSALLACQQIENLFWTVINKERKDIILFEKDKNEVNIPLAIQSCENIPEYATTKGFERLVFTKVEANKKQWLLVE
ncbi:21528_t:CDS:2 [Gigaspora rosea]|nr:21528_t:CDS:2 [Gigaspora rosea]